MPKTEKIQISQLCGFVLSTKQVDVKFSKLSVDNKTFKVLIIA